MTDRHRGYVVVLHKDIREDDAEATLNALRMVKGVLSVDPVTKDPGSYITETRVRSEMREHLFDLIKKI